MTLGYAFRFRPGGVPNYKRVIALAVLEALRRMAFCGRCEYYDHWEEQYDDYIVGIVLRSSSQPYTPNHHWWNAVVQGIEDALRGRIHVYRTSCEFARARSLRQTFESCGSAWLENGRPATVIDGAVSEFARLCEG